MGKNSTINYESDNAGENIVLLQASNAEEVTNKISGTGLRWIPIPGHGRAFCALADGAFQILREMALPRSGEKDFGQIIFEPVNAQAGSPFRVQEEDFLEFCRVVARSRKAGGTISSALPHSGGGTPNSQAESLEGIIAELMKSDASLSFSAALSKAQMARPDLARAIAQGLEEGRKGQYVPPWERGIK